MSYTNYIKVHQLIKLRREERALEILRDFIALDPEFGHYYHLLAYLLENKGDYKSAIEAVDNSIRLVPDKASFIAQKARIVLNLDMVKALKIINIAISIDPNDHRSHYTRSRALYSLGKQEKALDAILRAQSLKPDHCDILVLKYHILTAMGRTEEARKTLLESLEIDASNSVTLELLGRHDLDRNKIEKTKYLFQSALQTNPNSKRAQVGLKESVYRSDKLYNRINNYRRSLLNIRSITYIFTIILIVVIYLAYQNNYLFSAVGNFKIHVFVSLIFILFHVRWLSPLLLYISSKNKEMAKFHSATDKKVLVPIVVFGLTAISCFFLALFFSTFFSYYAFYKLVRVLLTSSLCCMYAILILDHYRSEFVHLGKWKMVSVFWTIFIIVDLYICMTTANFVNVGFILNLIFVVAYFTLKGVATKQDAR